MNGHVSMLDKTVFEIFMFPIFFEQDVPVKLSI